MAGGAAMGAPLLLGAAGLSVASGIMNFSSGMGQAEQMKTQIDAEKLAAREKAVALREQLKSTLATQTAMYGARGVDSLGTPQTVANATTAQTDRDLLTNKTNREMSLSGLRFGRDQTRIGAWSGLFSSLANAGLMAGSVGTTPKPPAAPASTGYSGFSSGMLRRGGT